MDVCGAGWDVETKPANTASARVEQRVVEPEKLDRTTQASQPPCSGKKTDQDHGTKARVALCPARRGVCANQRRNQPDDLQSDLPNLSISVGGGKESNHDCFSNG